MQPAHLAQQIHGIILTILWSGFANILLLTVKYYKHWQNYLFMHSLFGIINIISIVVIILVVAYNSQELFNYDGFSNMQPPIQAHFLIGMMFLFCIVGIQILGLVVKYSIQNTTAPPQVIIKRKMIHKIFGYIFFFLSKAQVALGWYVYYDSWNPVLTFIIIYEPCIFLFTYIFFQRKYRNQQSNIYVQMKQKPTKNQCQYQNLLVMIGNGISKKKIIQEFRDIKYILFKDKVYDVTKLNHPGGNFIIQNIIGEQISRYIIGAYGLQITKSNAYTHSIYANKLLQQYYIGQIDYSAIQLLIPKIGEKINIPAIWMLSKSISLTIEIKIFYFQCARYKINPNPNILYLGKHFLFETIKTKNPIRLYTLTLCMSPSHQQYISQIIRFLNHPSTQSQPKCIFPKEINYLPFIIKQYQVGGLSQHLHSLEDGEEIKIEGPFGRGLELQEGTYYGFCGGTGVLPLLDLIYEILLEIFDKVTNKASKRLPQNFKFILYLSVNTIYDLKGIQIITNTYLISEKYKLNIFKLFLRVSKGSNFQNIPKYERRLDHQMLSQILRKQDNLKKAFVCGSPSMNYEVSNNLEQIISKDKIHII